MPAIFVNGKRPTKFQMEEEIKFLLNGRQSRGLFEMEENIICQLLEEDLKCFQMKDNKLI